MASCLIFFFFSSLIFQIPLNLLEPRTNQRNIMYNFYWLTSNSIGSWMKNFNWNFTQFSLAFSFKSRNYNSYPILKEDAKGSRLVNTAAFHVKLYLNTFHHAVLNNLRSYVNIEYPRAWCSVFFALKKKKKKKQTVESTGI